MTQVEVHSCARCGEDHEHLEFEELYRPMTVGEHVLTHWATCPNTLQPILMAEISEGSGPLGIEVTST